MIPLALPRPRPRPLRIAASSQGSTLACCILRGIHAPRMAASNPRYAALWVKRYFQEEARDCGGFLAVPSGPLSRGGSLAGVWAAANLHTPRPRFTKSGRPAAR